MHYSTDPFVLVIDDDINTAEMMCSRIKPVVSRIDIFKDEFAPPIDEMIDFIKDKNYEWVICDNRLQEGGFATFYGAELASRLYEAKIPTLLVSTHNPVTEPSIIKNKSKIPSFLERSELSRTNPNEVKQAYTFCIEELSGTYSDERYPYDTIIRVEYIDKDGISICIPAWDEEETFELPFSMFLDEKILHLSRKDHRLYAKVNLGAVRKKDIYITDIKYAGFFKPWEGEFND